MLIYEEPTDVVCVFEAGSCVTDDLTMLELQLA